MATMWALLLASALLATTFQVSQAREVTNEDIRDAILSLLHMLRATEDKLERHEYRERALGEQLKKTLAGIEKRQRSDTTKGTLSRLDERLANVETILMQRDERERIQLQKVTDVVEDVQSSLPQWVETITDVLKEEKTSGKSESKPVNGISKDELQSMQNDLVGKVEKLTDAMNRIESQLKDVKENSKSSKDLNEKSVESLEKLEDQLKNSEQILEKYENKLAEFNNRVLPNEAPASKEKTQWQTNLLQAVETQKTNMEQILSDVKTISDKINKLSDNSAEQSNRNETLDYLEKLRHETESQSEKTSMKIEAQFKELQEDLKQKHEDFLKAISDIGEMTEGSFGDISKNYEQLRGEVQSLGKIEKVMLQTADNFLDIKRRVEHAVQQILVEVGILFKEQSKGINSTLETRFNTIEMSILESQTDSLQNLTTKLETEMSSVWRQIGIMHQQLMASTTALDRLQNQTDIYVTGSTLTMDSMEGKVTKITRRMNEVDENLNYLLGRLSLVTQEFNNIKTGLGAALDNIRKSFLEVQSRVKDVGPGPHEIPQDEHVERK